MPALKNTRHEAFAQALATGAPRDEAYAAAGFKPHRQNAHRLMTKDDVRARVKELQDKAAEKAEWTAADRLAALKRISDTSEKGDPRVAVSAISEANKMQGSHAPVRREHTGKDGGPLVIADLSHLKDMTDQELEILERALVQIGVAAGDSDGEGEPKE